MKNPEEKILAFKVNMINSQVIDQLKQLEKDGYITTINVGSYGEENNHKVYVVYYNGKVYEKCGQKGIYRSRSTAQAIITRKSEEHALSSDLETNMKDFYKMTEDERNERYLKYRKLVEEERMKFEIKEYTEVKKIIE